MIIAYRVGDEGEARRIELTSFSEFFTWLWNLGASVDHDKNSSLEWGTELFQALKRPRFTERIIALPRANPGTCIAILGSEDSRCLVIARMKSGPHPLRSRALVG